MLNRLFIKNIVLVESCEIYFEKGLNVLTGETGAGKSVILSALSFLMGDRIDTSLLRQGAENGVVEASFDIEPGYPLFALLQESGIDHSKDDELIVRRELSSSGKSRTFINNQAAQLALLKKISGHLIESCGQHAHMRLLEKNAPLLLLDTYGNLQPLLEEFQKAYKEEISIKKQLDEIKGQSGERLHLIETCQREIEEIEKAHLKEGEDEELFSQFSQLSQKEELSSIVSECLLVLEGEQTSILSTLLRLKNNFHKLATKSLEFKDAQSSYHNALVELKEISYKLHDWQSREEFSQEELAVMELRLKQISDLKKKYGPDISDVISWKDKQHVQLLKLENQDLELEKLEECLLKAHERTELYAKRLTEKRTIEAKNFAKAIEKEIQTLNMPRAHFEIIPIKKERTLDGDEDVKFFMTPNVGEKEIDIQEAASGGELARLTLALQTILVDRALVPTILFDEIDANIGGETAGIVGKKLVAMGKKRQVLCVTHFPQVAILADTHFSILKYEKDGRTLSTIQLLETKAQKTEEITRMLGGKTVADFAVAKSKSSR